MIAASACEEIAQLTLGVPGFLPGNLRRIEADEAESVRRMAERAMRPDARPFTRVDPVLSEASPRQRTVGASSDSPSPTAPCRPCSDQVSLR